MLTLGGCATPGPSHLYSVSFTGGEIHDQALDGKDAAREVPNFIAAGETVTGFAYDPFTDHFFLRLAPGTRIRVVDRPARKIKREFTLDGAPQSAGDLAVSPRDGHLFLVDTTGPQLLETTRLGRVLGTIKLAGRTAPAAAVAYDAERRHLLILGEDGRTVERYALDGTRVNSTTLARAVRRCLAYDNEEIFAPLAGTIDLVGVFDAQGTCVRTQPIAAGDQFIDVGPHSFLRVF